MDALHELDDLLHELDDHCAVGARNRELGVHYYGIQRLTLASLSLQSRHVRRNRCCPYKEHAHALDNQGDLGCEQDDRHGLRDCGYLACERSHASLALLGLEYLMALVRQ
jgi:hypothetical protein